MVPRSGSSIRLSPYLAVSPNFTVSSGEIAVGNPLGDFARVAITTRNPGTFRLAANALVRVDDASDGGVQLNDELIYAWDLVFTDTLAKAREAFRSLSKELRKISTDLGFPEGESLVELHCPMAFAGAGGSWLQRGGEVRNPYFGQEMLTCGEVRERLGAPADVHNH